jgi:acetyl-CoA carboxylase beta subunit
LRESTRERDKDWKRKNETSEKQKEEEYKEWKKCVTVNKTMHLGDIVKAYILTPAKIVLFFDSGIW